jgi:hypothetical protein
MLAGEAPAIGFDLEQFFEWVTPHRFLVVVAFVLVALLIWRMRRRRA